MEEREALQIVEHLNGVLAKQKASLKVFQDYYAGDFPLPYVPYEDQAEYTALLQRSITNWCRKVIDMTARRLDVMGLSSSLPGVADRLWSVWEEANMGGRQRLAYRSALRYGLGYELVARSARTGRTTIQPLSPLSTVHVDEINEPGVVAFAMHVSQVTPVTGPARSEFMVWTQDEWLRVNPAARPGARLVESGQHGLGQVPVVPFRNNPDEDGGWLSDLDGLTSIQDRINQTIADRLMVQSFGAYQQRLILGWAPPVDPATGESTRPLKPMVQRMMFLDENPDDIKVEELSATPLAPFIEATEADVRQLAALSDTPPHHLLGQMVNLSAEALKAAESGHSAKVDERKAFFTDPREDVFRLIALYEGLESDPALEVVWRDTEPQSEAQRVDALGKEHMMLQVPRETLWEKAGYSPQQIESMRQQLAAERQQDASAQAAAYGITG